MNILWSNRQCWKTTKKLSLFMMAILGLVSLIYYMRENLRPHQQYLRDTTTSVFLPCHRSPEFLRGLVQLVEDTITVMDSLNITSFLLYGTLWGAHRFQGPLPWDHDADIGIIGDENYHNAKGDFVRAFERKGIHIRDDWISTSYRVTRRRSEAKLGMFVFNDYQGKMERPGLESWIGFIHFKLYHTFPAWMVEKPLPTMTFGWINARVPRGKREIFKHLYPFHWQLEFFPTACKRKGMEGESLSKFLRENVNTRRPQNSGEMIAANGTVQTLP